MGEREELKKLYQDTWQAMIDKDQEKLAELHDASFVLVHMTGMRQERGAFISAVMNGDLNYYTVRHDHIDVAVKGDKVKVKGQSYVLAAVFGGGKNYWRLQLEFTCEKKKGKWINTYCVASTY